MGMIRFHESFKNQWEDAKPVLQSTLTAGRKNASKTMDSLVCDITGTASNRTQTDVTFRLLVLEHIPLHRWSIGLVSRGKMASSLSIDMHSVDYMAIFDIVHTDKYFEGCCVYVSVHTADHVLGLIRHPMYKMLNISLDIDLLNDVMDAAELLLEAVRPEVVVPARLARPCFLLQIKDRQYANIFHTMIGRNGP